MTALGRDEPRIIGPLPGPRSAAWLERDHRVMSPSYTRAYPLVVRRARGAMIEDMDGNRFLDFTAGIAVTNAGHSHPRVVAAIRKQAGRLIHMSGTDFYYTPQVRLAERLAALAPGPEPKRVFFTNSGAEAIEAALKLARRHTGRNRALAFMNAFHGRTYGAMSLSGSKPMQRRGFSPLVPEIHHARYGDLESVRPCCARSARRRSWRRSSSSRSRARGATSSRPPTSCRACAGSATSIGVLLVFDEVQSGIGRTGKMFASEHWGVAGDIVCLAKGIANGLPLGAIVARASVMDWPSGSHASTFGGNPVACAAALATLRLVERRYRANAVRRGRELREGLDRPGPSLPLHPRGARARADDRRRDPGSDGQAQPPPARPDHRPGVPSRPAPAPLRAEHDPVLPAALPDARARSRSGSSLIDAAMTAAVEETSRMQEELMESKERTKSIASWTDGSRAILSRRHGVDRREEGRT